MWIWIAAALACEPSALGRVLDALAHVDPAWRVDIAAAGFSEACQGPVPEHAAKWAQVPPEARRLVDAQAVLAAPDLWVAVCPAGLGAVATAGQMADGRGWLYDTCRLGDLGWFTRDAWTQGTAMFLPLLVGAHLRQTGTSEDRVRALVGAWLTPPTAPSPPSELLPFLEAPPEEPWSPEPPDDAAGVGGGTGVGIGSVTGGVLRDLSQPLSAPVRIVHTATPRWTARARSLGGTCRLRVEVSATGSVLAVTPIDCPSALTRPAIDAARRSAYQPAEREGTPIDGAVDVRFTVSE